MTLALRQSGIGLFPPIALYSPIVSGVDTNDDEGGSALPESSAAGMTSFYYCWFGYAVFVIDHLQYALSLYNWICAKQIE